MMGNQDGLSEISLRAGGGVSVDNNPREATDILGQASQQNAGNNKQLKPEAARQEFSRKYPIASS